MTRRPKRFGPEWWAAYSAAFVLRFADALRTDGMDRDGRLWTSDRADALGPCIAEEAAHIADRAIECFVEADAAGAVPRRESAESIRRSALSRVAYAWLTGPASGDTSSGTYRWLLAQADGKRRDH